MTHKPWLSTEQVEEIRLYYTTMQTDEEGQSLAPQYGSMTVRNDITKLVTEVKRLQGIEAERDEFLGMSRARYERIQQLIQEKLDYQTHMLDNLRKSDRIKDCYWQALQWYGNKENYKSEFIEHGFGKDDHYYEVPNIMEDEGKLARKTLEGADSNE